jgi:hypothetical protein
MRLSFALFAASASWLLSACDKDKEVDLPAELVDFQGERPSTVWSASVGGDMGGACGSGCDRAWRAIGSLPLPSMATSMHST